MEDYREFLNKSTSFKDLYIKNNDSLSRSDVSIEELYDSICRDVDIVLNILGVSPSKYGYNYWKDAVFIYILSGKSHISVCNDVYPLVARKNQKTTMAVERAMRLCFENSLYFSSKNSNNFVCDYFKNYLLTPHNSKIMVKLAEIITLKDFQKMKQNMIKGFKI